MPEAYIEYVLDATMVIAVLFAVISPASPLHAMREEVEPRARTEMVVSSEWLAKHWQDPDVIVICVAANRGFYGNGHIPGARLVDLAEIAVTRDGIPNELPRDDQLRKVFERAGVTGTSRIVLYGERYGLMAARAYFTLDYLGLAEHAALLDGGLEKWKTERRPLSTSSPQFVPSTLKISLNKSVVVDSSEMKKLSERAMQNSNGVTLIDARPFEEFSGQRLSEDVAKAGHIPAAVNLYWMENLVSRENPVLKTISELRRIYRKAGAASEVITYCRTGMQSSFDYFIAKYLGYKARMYDESFFQWSREDLPVERSK
jgi:thiosulfate/3-mercaptopyruvate sulfurtransferase